MPEEIIIVKPHTTTTTNGKTTPSSQSNSPILSSSSLTSSSTSVSPSSSVPLPPPPPPLPPSPTIIEITPPFLVGTGVVILIICLIIILLGSLGSNESSSWSWISIFGFLLCLFMIWFVFIGCNQLFGVSFVTFMTTWIQEKKQERKEWTKEEKEKIIQNEPHEPFVKEQVFNIPDNIHGYEDAKAVCAAYGARLATYAEVEKSYNEGGEWCNYGWSDEQMALFPTQQKTYDGLQEIKGHEHDCGRPGVNGGYMSNPLLKFGANCYGYKPKITGEEEQLMEVSTPYPKTEQDLLFEKRVDYWKSQINNILVSPFNYNTWSRI